MRPLIGVACCLIKDRRILLGRRISEHCGGHYSFPGGHVEFGERIDEAIKREVLEETGIVIKRPILMAINNHLYEAEGRQYITFIFKEHTDQIPKLMEPSKCEGWMWYDTQCLPEPLMPSMGSLQYFYDIGVNLYEDLPRKVQLV